MAKCDANDMAKSSGRARTGLIGEGILASRSPWLHENEAKALGLDLEYALYDFADRGWAADKLPSLLTELIDRGFAGTNVTLPFKQAILPLLDEVSDEAAAIGAVNTVAFRNGRSTGYNTDMYGFAEGMRRGLPDAKLGRVLLLGCGGAGAAVAHALLSELNVGTLVLHDVDPARAKDLRERLAGQAGADRVQLCDNPAAELANCDGLVNASPVGMAKFPGTPVPVEAIEPRHWVADIVYFPLETELLQYARSIGCPTLDGSRMVVHQAAEAFRIMTGHVADPDRMQNSFASFGALPSGVQG